MNTLYKPSKIQVGTKYNNILSVVEEPRNNSIKLRCRLCKTVDSYQLSQFKNNEIQGCKNCLQGWKIGAQINSYVVDFIFVAPDMRNGTFGSEKIKLRLCCKNCGDKKAFFVDQLDVKTRKNIICKCDTSNYNRLLKEQSIEETKNKKLEQLKQIKIQKEYEEEKKKAQDNKVIGIIASLELKEDSSKQNEVIGRFTKVGETTRRSATGSRLTKVFKLKCMRCGSVNDFSEITVNNAKSKFDTESLSCKYCSKIATENEQNILNNIDYTGYIKNDLEVIKVVEDNDGIKQAKLKCLICKHTMIVPLATFVNRDETFCSKCSTSDLKLICPCCKLPHIKINHSRLLDKGLTSTILKCPRTNKETQLQSLRALHENSLKLERIKRNYKGYSVEETYTDENNDLRLIKFKDSYTGTDDKKYNSCLCVEHNKMLILNQEEIKNYNHEYCSDSRMLPYKHKKK